MGYTGRHIKKFLLLFVAATLVPFLYLRAEAQSYQGFGATTPGGSGGTAVHVTNLNDSGPGSLREALTRGNRTVVFDVGGEINLTSAIRITGAFITIDGFTASSPGVTLRGAGLSLHGTKGAHDVIIRGIRIRNATATTSTDGITIAYGAYNIIVDHVSISGSIDENIDISEGSHDVTVSWSILGGNGKNMLIKYQPSRVTLHHNLFIESVTRNPQVRIDNAGTPATDTTLDMRNNIVWDWSGYGTLVWYGPRANIVNNYYSSSNSAIQVSSARAYVQGNVSADKIDVNRQGNETSSFPAPFVDTQDACTAQNLILATVGVRPLDSVDQQYLSRITAASCSATSPSLAVSPDGLAFGATVGGSVPPSQALTISNEGAGTLSWNTTVTTTNGGPWISFSPTSGTAPSALMVTANPLGLSEGLYHGTITVTAATATNSPRSIPVTLVIDRPPSGSETLQVRIATGGDDGMEYGIGGTVKTSEGLLDAGRSYLLAFRFAGVTIPPEALIESAVLKMYVWGNAMKSIKIRYEGEAAGDSAPFNPISGDLSNRPTTAAFVDDMPEPWIVGDFNPSPDLRSIIQEIVDHPDWNSGNSLTLFIADNGSSANRTIGSFESKSPPAKAAILTITYQAP